MFVYGPGSEHEGAGGHDWANLTIPKEEFERHLDRRRVQWEPPEAGKHSVVVRADVERLGRDVDAMCSGLFSGRVAPGSPITAGALLGAVVNAIEASTAGRDIAATGPSRWRSVDVVLTADAMLAKHGPITSVTELAEHLGISMRWMRIAFQSAIGISPKRYLTAYQLRGAREDLVTATPDGASVTDVAAKWGFWHLSRFAETYRAHYGEHPSHTLTLHD